MLGSIYQISIICGICFSYVIGAVPCLDYSHSALILGLYITLFLPLMVTLKESPRWLLMKNNVYAARKSLLWFFQSEEYVNQTMQHIQDSLPPKSLSFGEKLRMFTQRSVYIPFLLSIAIVFFHQYTGNNIIISYAALIFQEAQVDHAKETALYAIGILQIVSTVISAFVVDRVGRKKLLLFGSVGIALSTAVLGTHFFIAVSLLKCNNNSTSTFSNYTGGEPLNLTGPEDCLPSLLSILPITSIMGFGLFYSIGWRAIPFILMGEMFPTTLRSGMTGFMLAFLWGIAGVLIGGFTPYENAVGPYIAWWVFSAIAALSVPFIAIFVPETKGKTLEEIKLYFDQNKKVKRTIASATNPL